jgi:hypothetical protein
VAFVRAFTNFAALANIGSSLCNQVPRLNPEARTPERLVSLSLSLRIL